LHQFRAWLADFTTIADTINRHPKIRPANRLRVLRKLCLWVWQDPNGPKGAGRVGYVDPAKVAKRCSGDIDAAVQSQWVADRIEPLPAEAAS
jgi:hypothetical protein